MADDSIRLEYKEGLEHNLDMTHVTDCKGRPQTLVCTKDRRSYQRRCAEYRADIAALATLAALAVKAKVSADLVERISTTRARGWSPARI